MAVNPLGSGACRRGSPCPAAAPGSAARRFDSGSAPIDYRLSCCRDHPFASSHRYAPDAGAAVAPQPAALTRTPSRAAVTLTLLGPPLCRIGARRLRLTPARPQQLLVYLALAGGPVARSAAAALLWPQRPAAAAGSNLRNLLHRLRSLPIGAAIEEHEQTLAAAIPSDVLDLRAALQRGDDGAALAAVGAPLLPGFEHSASEPFCDWLHREREQLHAELRAALLRAAPVLPAEPLLARAEALLAIDPLDEPLQQWRMRALAAQGRRGAALAAFNTLAQRLMDEYGLEVAPATRDLARTLGLGEASAAAAPGVPSTAAAEPPPAVDQHRADRRRRDRAGPAAAPAEADSSIGRPAPALVEAGPTRGAHGAARGLPLLSASGAAPPLAATTPLIGRASELATLAARLREQGPRMLTVTGPGGIGKTALLQALAQRLQATLGAPRLEWIALQGQANAADAAALIERRLAALPPQPVLLLLDNCEPFLRDATAATDEPGALPPAASNPLRRTVARLLAGLPALRVVATSRIPLGLPDESVFALRGLRGLAGRDDHAGLGPAVARQGVHRRQRLPPALELFLRDSPAHRGRAPHADELPALGRIAALTGGLPLALKLAARWTSLLSCEEIAQDLAQQLDVLGRGAGPVLPFAAVIERSWVLLVEPERRALRCLAVMPGSFDRALAQAAAGANLALLAQLADHSLLEWRSQDGHTQYRLHPLVRQWLLQPPQARPLEQQAAGLRVLRCLQARAAALPRGQLPAQARSQLFTEIDRHGPLYALAVEQAGAAHDAAALADLLPPLCAYMEYPPHTLLTPDRQLLPALAALRAAVVARRATSGAGVHDGTDAGPAPLQRALAVVAATTVLRLVWEDRFDEARQWIYTLRADGLAPLPNQVLIERLLLLRDGRIDAAIALLRARRADPALTPKEALQLDAIRGEAETLLPARRARGIARLQDALARLRAQRAELGDSRIRLQLVEALCAADRVDEALAAARAGVALARRSGRGSGLQWLMLATAQLAAGAAGAAAAAAARALASLATQPPGFSRATGLAHAWVLQTHAELLRGRDAAAAAALHAALETLGRDRTLRDRDELLRLLPALAQLLAAQGRRDEAQRVLQVALADPLLKIAQRRLLEHWAVGAGFALPRRRRLLDDAGLRAMLVTAATVLAEYPRTRRATVRPR